MTKKELTRDTLIDRIQTTLGMLRRPEYNVRRFAPSHFILGKTERCAHMESERLIGRIW